MKRWVLFLLTLGPMLASAQSETRIVIFDVKDLVGQRTPTGTARAVDPTVRDIVEHLKERVEFKADERVEIASEGADNIVLFASPPTIEKARTVLDAVRSKRPAYRVTIVGGTMPEATRKRLDLTQDRSPKFLTGYGELIEGTEWTVTMSESSRVVTLRDNLAGLRGDGSLRGEFLKFSMPHESAGKDPNAPPPIEFEKGSFASADVPAIVSSEIGAVRSRKFLTNLGVEKDVEGHPDGVPVPQFTTYEEGTRATISIIPSKDGKLATMKLRFDLCAIDPVVDVYDTERGRIWMPKVKRNTLEATISVPQKATVLVPAPDWTNFVMISINALEPADAEKK